MPHIHIEYSSQLKDLDTQHLMLSLHQAFLKQGFVSDVLDLKSRAVAQHDYLIGLERSEAHAYVHAKVSLLSGRSEETKTKISQTVLQIMQQCVSVQKNCRIQLCVEIIEMPKACYSKASI